MGLFDKLTGTRHPQEGVSPVLGEELRAALLGLNQPEVPYVIRYGGGEQCDLLAEWRLTEPAWQQGRYVVEHPALGRAQEQLGRP